MHVESDEHGIKATVKLYGINRNVCCRDLCAFYANVPCCRKHCFTCIGQKHTHILIAIPITARIKNSRGLNAKAISAIAARAAQAGKFIFSHI
jgi:hypothetical protein